MKISRRFCLFFLVSCAALFAAEKKSAPAGAGFAGRFAGTWKADEGGAAGDLEITLRRDERSGWAAEPVFTFEGTRIPGAAKSVEIAGRRLVIVFDWRIQDTSGQSTVTGTLDGDALGGAYESKTADGTTRGTWSLRRAPAPQKK
ncbi:MAG: hypothetical protein JNL39_12645 [Opitutaceae bacterium]|nr:hypothetical protein [Opitutaceae bacterium]